MDGKRRATLIASSSAVPYSSPQRPWGRRRSRARRATTHCEAAPRPTSSTGRPATTSCTALRQRRPHRRPRERPARGRRRSRQVRVRRGSRHGSGRCAGQGGKGLRGGARIRRHLRLLPPPPPPPPAPPVTPVTPGSYKGLLEGNFVFFEITSDRMVTGFRSNFLREDCNGDVYIYGTLEWGASRFRSPLTARSRSRARAQDPWTLSLQRSPTR